MRNLVKPTMANETMHISGESSIRHRNGKAKTSKTDLKTQVAQCCVIDRLYDGSAHQTQATQPVTLSKEYKINVTSMKHDSMKSDVNLLACIFI